MAAILARMSNSTRLSASSIIVQPARTHYGYLPFEGRVPNDQTPRAIQRNQLKALNFKPVKRITFQVDPCHRGSASIRQLMTLISNPKVTKTGPKTIFKYDFVTDRSEPKVTLTFHDTDQSLVFKTAHLTEHEIISELNKFVLPLVKADTTPSALEAKKSRKKK